MMPGARVRVVAPHALTGLRGTVVRHYPATGNCMIRFAEGDTRGLVWLPDRYLSEDRR